jgi:predicted metalloprotease
VAPDTAVPGTAPASASASEATGGGTGDPAEDVDSAVTTVEEYWRGQFAARGVEFRPVQGVFGYDSPTDGSCGGRPLVMRNAAYCPAEDWIAYDQAWLTQDYRDLGDSFVYYVIGHEYAHAIQARLGLRSRFPIQQELQADCLAGAYMGDQIRAGVLVLEKGDVDELLRSLASVADDPGVPWFAEGAHGTVRQRTNAFANGYRVSAAACNLP